MAKGLEERFGLDGKVAVVTGAGMGIGREVALTLAEAGAAVVVQDLSADGANKVADEVEAAGGKAIAIGGDAGDENDLRATLELATKELGGLDIIVNNAGIYPFSSILEMDMAEWDKVMRLNLRGAYLATRMAGQIMVDAGKGGRIVSLASTQGLRPSGPGVSHYNMAKAGIIMMTKSAALEFAEAGVSVNAVAPGIVTTPGTKEILDSGGMGDPKERVPLHGRWSKPEEIANTILFLVAPASSHITGETIVVDGGFLLH